MRVLPVVLIGVAALAAAGEIATSVRAGNEFADRLRALDGSPLGTPQLRLSKVQVQRGLFHSSATADLLLEQPAATRRLPIRLEASQGLLPNGSALRVEIALDLAQAPRLQELATALHDPQPMLTRIDVGLSGQIRRIRTSLAPAHGALPSGKLQLDWGGARMVLSARDYFGAGAVHGDSSLSARWEPMRITPLDATPEQAASAGLEIGALSQTAEERGRYTNASGHLTMNMGPTVLPFAAGGLRIDGVQAAAQYGVHRLGDAQADNPSGLPAGMFELKDLQLTATVSKPVAASVHLNAKLRLPEPVATGSQPQTEAGQKLLAQATANVQLRATSALFERGLQPLLGRLLELGYVSMQGPDVVTTLVVDNGRVTANGKEIEP